MRTTGALLVAVISVFPGCAGTIGADNHPSPTVIAQDRSRAKGVARLRIHRSHFPAPGSCRIWYPGRSAGDQPPPGPCAATERNLPPGAWLLYRPREHPDEIHVTISDLYEPRGIVAIRVYECENGRLLRETP